MTPNNAADTQPLDVLMVSARYFPLMGGTETHTYEVAHRLAQAGHHITVLTTNPGNRLPAHESADGVCIIRTQAWPANRDYYFAPGMLPVITDKHWDVIHIQGYHTLVAPLAMFAALIAKTPYVVTFHSGGHSSGMRNKARGFQRQLLRPLLAHAAQLIGVSEFEADFFSEQLGLPRERFEVIPNGARLGTIPPQSVAQECEESSEHAPLIVSVGRLERYKQHQKVIRAFRHVLEQRPDARLRIAGAGPYEDALHTLVDDLKLSHQVEIKAVPPSDRQAMAQFLSSASLVTLFSDYEAHPISVMEALSLRRPVLVTYTSGLGELADRGLARAIPVDCSDVDAAKAIIHQLEAPLIPSALDLPTWEACATALEAIYRRVSAVSNRTSA